MMLLRGLSAELLEAGMRPHSPRAQQEYLDGKDTNLGRGPADEPNLRVSLLRKTHERQVSSSSLGAESRSHSLSCTPTASSAPAHVAFFSGSNSHRDTVRTAVATAVALLVLLLVALCTVAITSHGQHGEFHGVGRGSALTSRGFHLLAEGMASIASSLDRDAVEEFAPERGYVRKALHHTQDAVQEQIRQKEILQEYYDAEVARLSQELEEQRIWYENKLEEQQKVLVDVFGDDTPKQAVASSNVDHEQLI